MVTVHAVSKVAGRQAEWHQNMEHKRSQSMPTAKWQADKQNRHHNMQQQLLAIAEGQLQHIATQHFQFPPDNRS